MKKWQGWVGLAAAVAALGCGAGSKLDSNPEAKQAKPIAGSAAAKATTEATQAPTTKAATAPKPSDFTLSVKTTRKACFGSAGCNIEYHIEVATDVVGDPDTEYLVTYEVSGVQDGPAVNSFTFQGTKYTRDDTESASTPRSSTKLKAKVTSVEEN